MTDDQSWPMWHPAMFVEGMQEASEQAIETQQEMWQQFARAGAGNYDDLSELGVASLNTAVFKTRVQSSGRISIPDAEREALDIEEGDIVQTVVIPVKRNRSDSDE